MSGGDNWYLNENGMYETGRGVGPPPQTHVYSTRGPGPGRPVPYPSASRSPPTLAPASPDRVTQARLTQQFAANRAEATQAAQAELDARVDSLTLSRWSQSLYSATRNDQAAYQEKLRDAHMTAAANIRAHAEREAAHEACEKERGEDCCGRCCHRTRVCTSGWQFLTACLVLSALIAIPIAALVFPLPASTEYDTGCGAMWVYCLVAFVLAFVAMVGALIVYFSDTASLRMTWLGKTIMGTGLVLVFGVMFGMAIWSATMLVEFKAYAFDVCKSDTANHNRLYVVSFSVCFMAALYPLVAALIFGLNMLQGVNLADKEEDEDLRAPHSESSGYVAVPVPGSHLNV